MLTEIPAEQFAAAVDDCAAMILAESEISGPPVDAMRIAAGLGLVVALDRSMEERARFVRLGTGPRNQQGAIFLGEEPRPERRQWAVAHEVGECMAHRLFRLLDFPLGSIPDSGRERAANYLAMALLLPRAWFERDGHACNWDLQELKEIYPTASYELIARRMLELASPVIITLFDQGAVQWRRSNIPEALAAAFGGRESNLARLL